VARNRGRGKSDLAGYAYAGGIALLVAQAAVTAAWAQTAPLPTGPLPSQKPLAPPEFRKPPPEELKLPPVSPPAGERLPTLRVLVRTFHITGNTVFPDAELQKIAAPFENREITNTDLEELRQRLTVYYVNRGYINSGAVIPDQKVTAGVIEIRIVEGRLSQTEIAGTKHFDKSYFTDRIALHAGPPLNIRNLEQELQILLRDPMVKSMNAQLVPGARPGEAVLRANVEEAPRYDIGLVIDNKLSPALGELKGTLLGSVSNLNGHGDQLSGEFGYADGIPYDFKLNYRTPINARDTAIGLHYEYTKAEVVESPFDVLDIQSKLESYGGEISHPVYRTPDQQLTLAGVVERRETSTTLLGVPFSFSPGVVDGKAVVSVGRLVGDYVNRGRTQVIAARSTLSVGLDAFGSTIHSEEPDSRFVTWLGQFQWVQRLSERGDQLHLRADLQIASDALLPVEQYAVGGLDSVRGYRAFQLLRDQGYTASLEYRIPVFSNPSEARNLQFAAFVDTGGAKFRERDNPGPSRLTGVGVGLIWVPAVGYSAELYYAKGLDDVPDPASHSIQDESIYFRLVAHPGWLN
jgi:hemolysin activation/secretion protein